MKFPRAVWAGSHFKNQPQMKRLIVHNEEEYSDFIRTYNGRMNCYTTVYDFTSFRTKYDSYGNEISEVNQESVVLDRIFLDFDSHKEPLVESLIDVDITVDYLLKNDYQFNVLFSGKGFHIYVYGTITDNIRSIQSYFNEILKNIQDIRNNAETMLDTNNGTTLDNSGVQTYRLRRIANTMNMSANNYCVPLLIDDLKDIDHILSLSTKSRPSHRKIYGTKKVNWPTVLPISEAPVEIAVAERIGDLPIIPCLKQVIMVENPSHEARVYTVSFYRDLLSLGNRHLPYEESRKVVELIMAELRKIAEHDNVWLDWDEETTRYHVQYIVNGGYYTPNCSKLINKGRRLCYW